MSEYFTVRMERTNDPDVVELITNQTLETDGEEVYESVEEGEEGSTLAQTIFFAVEGIAALRILGESLIITRDPDYPWEVIVDEVRDTLRDFFL